MSRFQDSTVLVTGGSRGLGRALALDFATRGARVAVVARDLARVEWVVAEIRERGGVAHGISADIADRHATFRIAGEVGAVFGPVDVLVHSASTLGATPLRPLLDTQCEDLERVLQVNVIGAFRLSKAVLGAMVARGHGQIVHISSDAALEAYADWGAYGISKAAFDSLARIWAAELEGSGVSIVSFDPGEMDTEMHAAALPIADRSSLRDPAWVASRLIAALERPTGPGRWQFDAEGGVR